MAWIVQATDPPWGDTLLTLVTTQVCFATACGCPMAVWAGSWRGVSWSSPGAGVGLPNVNANEPGMKHNSSSAADLALCSQLCN